MAVSSFSKLRIYLHLVPVLGVVPSLWSLYKMANRAAPTGFGDGDIAQVQSASRISVLLGIGCISVIALLGAGASSQASQLASLRFLLASSFVGSGYFLVSLMLMFRVAQGRSIRIAGLKWLARRLP